MDNNIIQGEQILNQKYVVINLIRNNTYLARDLNSSSRVIIKKFSFGESNWNNFSQVENEIKILKNLNHPQIPKYLDSSQEDNNFYLVQEYIAGEELSTQKVLPEKEIIDIAKQLLSILIYLQSFNFPVVHHDIKPENILVNKEGKIYLVDFGISKEITGRTIGVTTQFGGTEGFIAPEKMLGKKLDIRSDLYSLGMTLACLITRTSSSKAVSLLSNDFELRREILSKNNCSRELFNWVQRLVKLKPENRFENAKVALDRLLNISSNNSLCKASQKYIEVLSSQDEKRRIEIRETGDIKLGFINLTIIFVTFSTLFLIPPILSFDLCPILSRHITECSVDLTRIITHGLIGYLPWISINESLFNLTNFIYDFISYWLSFLFVSISFVKSSDIIIKEEYYRFKNILLRFLLLGYSLLTIFLIKTCLIGYFPIRW